MIPPYPPEPRYGDAWKNPKATMREASIYGLPVDWELYSPEELGLAGLRQER